MNTQVCGCCTTTCLVLKDVKLLFRGRTTLLSHRHRAPAVPRPHQHVAVSGVSAVPIAVHWQLIFNLHFPGDKWCQASFMCPSVIWVSLLRGLVSDLLPVFACVVFLLLSFKSSLCILNQVLYQMCILQIFPYLFTVLTVCFVEQKFLILIESNLAVFFLSCLNCFCCWI